MCPTLCDPLDGSLWDMSWKEYWNGLPFPPPGDLPDPGIKPSSPTSPAGQADFLSLSHGGSQSHITWVHSLYRAMCPQLTEGSLWISSLDSEGQVHRPSLSLALLETLRLHTIIPLGLGHSLQGNYNSDTYMRLMGLSERNTWSKQQMFIFS